MEADSQLMLDRSYDLFFNHVISLDEKCFRKGFANILLTFFSDEALRQIQIDVSQDTQEHMYGADYGHNILELR